MRESSRGLFNFGLWLAHKSVEPSLHSQLKQSDISERIARDLWHANCLQVGVEVEAWGDLPAQTKLRYREKAETAIRTLDPHVEINARREAIQQTMDWVENGYYYGPGEFGTREIAQYAIEQFMTNSKG